MLVRSIFALCLIALPGLLIGQKSIQDTSISFISISGKIGFQYPFADLADRFGSGGIVGGGLTYKTSNNFTYHVGFGYTFGKTVKDSVLNVLLTDQGIIINRYGEDANVSVFARGWLIGGSVGKIFPVIGPNPNCGIHASLGTGFMQHKIKIQDDFEEVPQLAGEYKKGYDRLTNGWMFSQSVGYMHFSNYRLINYYVGVEFVEGITQNRRSYNYDTGRPDNTTRLDILGSVVLKWYFPMYKRKPKDFYFY